MINARDHLILVLRLDTKAFEPSVLILVSEGAQAKAAHLTLCAGDASALAKRLKLGADGGGSECWMGKDVVNTVNHDVYVSPHPDGVIFTFNSVSPNGNNCATVFLTHDKARSLSDLILRHTADSAPATEL